MVTEVTKYKTADGALFDCREAAVLHERNVTSRKALVTWLASNVGRGIPASTVEGLFHRMSNNADEVIDLLKPYSVKENI